MKQNLKAQQSAAPERATVVLAGDGTDHLSEIPLLPKSVERRQKRKKPPVPLQLR